MTVEAIAPAARLARYRAVVLGDEQALGVFYQWAQDLSMAMFCDIATLEVALRSTIARELTQTYGSQWHKRRELFEQASLRRLDDARRRARIVRMERNGAPAETVANQVVASLSFGFWTGLLGRGASAGGQRKIYDTIMWKAALHRAFPQAESRRSAERHALTVQVVRNRIAHHEHIIWGVPLPGQRRRLSVASAHGTLLSLARMISPEVRAWIEDHSTVEEMLARCPVDEHTLLLRSPKTS